MADPAGFQEIVATSGACLPFPENAYEAHGVFWMAEN